MRVLGIDCGTRRTGYGVIDSDGATHRFVTCGVIATNKKDPLDIRLLTIARGLRRVIEEFQPDGAAVEEVFHALNAGTALKLAHVRGVALLTAAECGLPVGAYSPAEIKISVVGHGRAEKPQVQLMVRSVLRLESDVVSEDASDALAVAICHATHGATKRKLEVGDAG
jgi:crossover junction endodeoxyribonuclease RuvC